MLNLLFANLSYCLFLKLWRLPTLKLSAVILSSHQRRNSKPPRVPKVASPLTEAVVESLAIGKSILELQEEINTVEFAISKLESTIDDETDEDFVLSTELEGLKSNLAVLKAQRAEAEKLVVVSNPVVVKPVRKWVSLKSISEELDLIDIKSKAIEERKKVRNNLLGEIHVLEAELEREKDDKNLLLALGVLKAKLEASKTEIRKDELDLTGMEMSVKQKVEAKASKWTPDSAVKLMRKTDVLSVLELNHLMGIKIACFLGGSLSGQAPAVIKEFAEGCGVHVKKRKK